MSTTRYGLCVSALTAIASLSIATLHSLTLSRGTACAMWASRMDLRDHALSRQSHPYNTDFAFRGPLPPRPQNVRLDPSKSAFNLPLTFEANAGQAAPRIQFLARSQRSSFLLTNDGIDVHSLSSARHVSNPEPVHITFTKADPNARDRPQLTRRHLVWKGIDKLTTETNYLIGPKPRWHAHVPHFARAQASGVLPGLDVIAYNKDAQLEFDLRIAPSFDADRLRLNISGAQDLRLSPDGDLLIQLAGSLIRMRRPALYEEKVTRELRYSKSASFPLPLRMPIEGAYILESDGSIGFRISERHKNATLVIDPSLSVQYTTFLGGTGEDVANSIALDSAGKVYIGGTTTSASTFSEPVTKPSGPGGGATDFFIAKIDPTLSGASSLIYLTFVGGSGAENGGMIAVDKSGDVALTGTTTSSDYPVTDASKLTTGANDVAVTELGPTGATLIYSTLFGGSGAESTQNPGGIALDSSGSIFVASDTTSTDLPVTTGAFQIANGGGISDGFLAVFRLTTTPNLKYCTYLGIDAQVGVGGIAVDSTGNAYIAGFTSNPGTTFPTMNGFLTTYGGDPFDAFVIKIRPSGTGAGDLAYGTFLGGAGLDQALAISVGTSLPAVAYVTGTTQSTNFPVNGTSAAAQSNLKGTANAFVAAIAQDAATELTSLLYSTYLGGTQSDSGLGIAFVAPNAVYIAGKTTSWDFPWLDNFQPFNGNEDAFVAKLDPTSSGPASLTYATPLAGTAPAGGTAITDANAVTAGVSGNVYVAGSTTAADFPRASNLGNGMQLICASCQQLPPTADAFLLAFQENAAPAPSVSFTALRLNFGAQAVGASNIPPLFAAVVNTGNAPLNLNSIAITGPNSSSFSLVGTDPCIGNSLPPHGTCSFEVGFTPSSVGPEEAFVAIGDDAPGNPQVLAIVGQGAGPLAVLSTSSISFSAQPQGSTSVAQSVTILNEGNQDLHITNLSIGGLNANEFLIEDDTCDAKPVPAAGACTIDVVFSPLSTGPFQAGIDLIDDSGGTSGAKQVITLNGTGTNPAPIVSILPASLTFGVQAVSTTSGTQSVQVRNLGSTSLNLTLIGITGTDAASFAIVPSGNNSCPSSSGSVAVGASCNVAIDFAPQSGGTKTAALSFSDNASGSPQLINLAGTGIAPTIQISPVSLSFAPQSTGTASASQSITITNTGTSTVALNQISIAGVNTADFSESSNCSSLLGAASSCIVSVTFDPTTAGNRSASILISDDAAGSPQTIPLIGMATQSAVSLSPTNANFASQLVGTASPPVAITITNAGSGALQITAISFSGANPGDFSEKDTCKGTVAPAANCAVNLTFTPTAVGTRSAMLVVADNAPGSPQSIPITAAAMDFSIGPSSAGATSVTIAAGQSATYQLAIQSLNGFAGTVTFTCSGAPAGANCVVPSPLTIAANASVPFQINVATTARPQATTATLRNDSLASSTGAKVMNAAALRLPSVEMCTETQEVNRDEAMGRTFVPRSQRGIEISVARRTHAGSMNFLDLRKLAAAMPTILLAPVYLERPGIPAFLARSSSQGLTSPQNRPQNRDTACAEALVRVHGGGSKLAPVQPAGLRLAFILALMILLTTCLSSRASKTNARVVTLSISVLVLLAVTAIACTNASPTVTTGTPAGTSTLSITASALGASRTTTVTLTVQ